MTVRIGFLGAGFIARYHAHQLGAVDVDHQVVSVFDPAVHRAEKFAEWQSCALAATVDELIEASDAVFICTWTSEHPAQLAAVTAAGRAVFCEKPLGVDLSTARQMAATVAAAGVVNMTGLVLRSQPALLALRELIGDPTSGRIMNVVFRDDQYIPTQGMYRSSWRGERDKAGAGTLLEHSIHDLDILEWLCGPIATISAHTHHFHGLDGIEDSVSVLARFVEGHSATLSSIWHDILDRPSLRRMEVFSERSLAVLEADDGPVTWQRDGDHGRLDDATLVPWLAQRGISPQLAEEQFLDAVVAGGPSPTPTIADAVRPHVLADAAYRSAATGGAAIDVTP